MTAAEAQLNQLVECMVETSSLSQTTFKNSRIQNVSPCGSAYKAPYPSLRFKPKNNKLAILGDTIQIFKDRILTSSLQQTSQQLAQKEVCHFLS